MQTIEVKNAACKLLARAGFNQFSIKSIEQIYGGGNNQIYLLDTSHKKFILKKYFEHDKDRRDRMGAEFSFLLAAKARAPHQIPTPYAKDDEGKWGLYEYVEGYKIDNSEKIVENFIAQAVNFIVEINVGKAPVGMPNASEACFSIQDHISCVENRLSMLREVNSLNFDFRELLGAIDREWNFIHAKLLKFIGQNRLSLEQPIPANQRIISPSDFGFHNAIVKSDGTLTFIDFEYAGWDDPAKLVGDFFAQVAVPVGSEHLTGFIESLMLGIKFDANAIMRSMALINLYKIKWCCIVLNIFISENLQRRIFAQPELDVEDLQKQQLLKARNLLDRIDYGLP